MKRLAIFSLLAFTGCLQWEHPEQSFCDANPLNAECIDGGLSPGPAPTDGGGCTQSVSCYDGPEGTEGKGICHAGLRPCVDGILGACANEVRPTDEVCNDADDDCDGTVDELGTLSCGVGACAVTVNACSGGADNVCEPNAPAPNETCANDSDDDCDGVTDCAGEPLTILPVLTPDGGTVTLSAVASNGSETYVVGALSGTTNVGGAELTSATTDALVLRMNPDDGGVLWARVYGGSGVDRALSVAVDSLGNAYVGGEFDGVFDAGAGGVLTPAGTDGFVLALQPDGTVLWAGQVSDANDAGSAQSVSAVSLRLDNKLVIAGTFNNTVQLGTRAVATRGMQDVFIATLDSADGGSAALKRMGGTKDDQLVAIAVDPANNRTYVMCNFTSDFLFDGGSPRNANGKSDVMVVRVTSSLTYSTQEQFGDVGDDFGTALSLDSAGNVTYAIETDNIVGVGGSCGIVSSPGSARPVLVKADTDIACTWNELLPRGSTLSGIAGEMPLTVGSYSGAADFGKGIFNSSGQTDWFMAQFDTDGGVAADGGVLPRTAWARHGGGSGIDSLDAIARTSAAGWAVGNHASPFNFKGVTVPAGGSFVLKLNP